MSLPPKKNKILIVEDEEINIAIYKSLLEDRYQLFIAETGKAAEEIIEKNVVDIVLLDLILPDADGISLCKAFKANETYKKIPIIIVTAVESQETKVKALEAGANNFLRKPIDNVELFLKIKNHLQIKSLHDELNDSFESIVTLNNISHRIMKDFDPQYFDFKRDLFTLLEGYTSQVEKRYELPQFILMAYNEQEGELQALVYKIKNNFPVFIGEPFYISETNNCVFRNVESDTIFLNRGDTPGFEKELKTQFPPDVTQKIGAISNFIGYRGKEVCLIGINYEKEVNQFMAQTLKSIALTSNFFKVIQEQVNEVRDAHLNTLNSLARAAEASDQYTGAHILRVNYYSGFIAKKLGLPEKMVNDIYVMAQMHDIGKIHIHPDIIRKTGKLTGEEWKEIKRHPIYGAEILGDSQYLEAARNICMGHHENFDGSGYPFGKKGEEIPIEARIVRLADVYDSLRSERTYKPGYSHRQTCDIILNGFERVRPYFFDPKILEIFKEHHHEFETIFSELAEE
jgi:response regulator RpfG family c-di-GMP phosphodiesterase